MKRYIAASCALGLLAAPAAALETAVTVDGHFGFSGAFIDNDAGDNTNFHNNASRIGLQAEVAEGGYKGFVRYERGMDIYNPNSSFEGSQQQSTLGEDFVREFYAGIDTPYGRVTGGQFRAAYARAGQRIDPFYDTSVAGFTGNANTFGGQGANYGLSNLTNGFSQRAIELQSKDYDGLQVNANIYVDNTSENDHDYGLGVSYAAELVRDQPFEVSLQFLEIRNEANVGVAPFNDVNFAVGGSPGKSSNFRLSGIYDLGIVSLGANYEYVDVEAEDSGRHYSTITATLPLDSKLSVAAAVSYLDFPSDGPSIDGFGATLGAFYEILPNLNAYGALRYVNFDEDQANGSDSFAVAVGAGYSFDMRLR